MSFFSKLTHAFPCAVLLLASASSMAANLTIDIGSKVTFSTEQLLSRSDATTIHIPDDVAFHRTMTYRAVPLRALLGVARLPDDQEIQITGTDGFVTRLPAQLVFDRAPHRAIAWLAIEPADAPWPRTPGGDEIGPFYVVWTDAAVSNVKSEQWPYKVDAIRQAPSFAAKWPQIMPNKNVPANSPIRAGQSIFATQCMACHKMNGAGDATMGPDLNLPHNPTEYFQPWVLKQFIRDPKSIRAWPDMKMHGFPPSALSDGEINALITYLRYMANHKN